MVRFLLAHPMYEWYKDERLLDVSDIIGLPTLVYFYKTYINKKNKNFIAHWSDFRLFFGLLLQYKSPKRLTK